MQQGGRPCVLELCPDERVASAMDSKPDWKVPSPVFGSSNVPVLPNLETPSQETLRRM